MSAFGGKADMTIGTCPLLRSLLGVKRTSSPTKNQARLKEKSNSSSSLLSVRRLSAAGRHNARHRQPSQNRSQRYRHLNRMVAATNDNPAADIPVAIYLMEAIAPRT